LLLGCLPLRGQTDSVFDLPGILELADRPPDGTPVEVLTFQLHPLEGGFDVEARPDRDGKFTLSGVRPGRYSLTFPMPGRIQTFANGREELAPEEFELKVGSVGPLRLVVSMKSADIAVKVSNFPSGHTDVVALLAPADTHLTLRLSCNLNQMSGPQTKFRFVPPGKYRIIIFDAQFQQDVAAYAPRSSDFLKNEATSVEVPDSGETDATATYLDSQTVREAIRQAGGPFDPFGRRR
jgi:hypothetical protein